jgi:hypothetical protein
MGGNLYGIAVDQSGNPILGRGGGFLFKLSAADGTVM